MRHLPVRIESEGRKNADGKPVDVRSPELEAANSAFWAELKQRLHAKGIDTAGIKLDSDKGPVPPGIGPEVFSRRFAAIHFSSITVSKLFCLPRRIMRCPDACDLTICCCQSVAFMIATMVVPFGCRSIASTVLRGLVKGDGETNE